MKNKNGIVLSTELAKKVANRKLVEVDVHRLRVHPLQPPTRLRIDTPKYKELLASVKDVGILENLHYSDNTMNTFDGHRRRLALLDIGTKSVFAYRYDNLTEKEEQILFRYLNTTSLSFSRKQKVDTYLAGGDADGETIRACGNAFKIGEHLYGNGQKFLHKIARSKMCMITLNEATTAFVNYIKKDRMFNPADSDVELRAMIYKYCSKISSPYHLKQILCQKAASPKELYVHINKQQKMETKTILVDE